MTVSGRGNSRHWASDCIGCVDTMPASISPSIYRIDTNIIAHPYREHMSDRIIGRGRRNPAQSSQDDPCADGGGPHGTSHDGWRRWAQNASHAGRHRHPSTSTAEPSSKRRHLWAVFSNSFSNSLFNPEYPDNSACLSPSRTASLSTRLSSKVRNKPKFITGRIHGEGGMDRMQDC